MTTAVATFPRSLDKARLERARRPLAAVAAALLAIDLIGLGLNFADAVDSPFTDDGPTTARTRVSGSDAVVNGSITEAPTVARPAKPVGCLAISSGCFPGDTVTGTTPGTTGSGTGTGTGTTTGTPTTPNTPPTPTPALQANIAVPALDTQVSVGLGDGGCTGLALTALEVGACPAAEGEGGIVLDLGGSLLGE